MKAEAQNPGLANAISADQARLLYANAVPANVTVIIGAIILGIVSGGASHASLGWIVSTLLILGAASRLVLHQVRRRNPDSASPVIWIRRYTQATLALGVTWAATPLLAYFYNDVVFLGLVLLALITLMSASVPVLAIVMPAFYCYVLPSGITLPLVLSLRGDTMTTLLALASAVYTGLTIFTAGNTNRVLLQSISLRHEKQCLAGRLGDEVQLHKLAQLHLEEFQGNLQEMVAGKTRELEIANRKLEQEVSERKQAEQEIERLAYYDSLTDLPNRRLLLDELQRYQARMARNNQFGAILFLDLDNFKGLNDSRGHTIGDALLKQVAHRLLQRMRGGDFVARLGGDEFVVILSDLGNTHDVAADHAATVTRNIMRTLHGQYRLQSAIYHASACIGITIFQGRDNNADELMKQADVAMYRAKASGRGAFHFYSPEMQQAANARLRIDNDLRNAVANGEFELLYQPQVDLDGRIVGAEALIRWNHPEHGLISPVEFIPIAEDNGLIVQVGEWVLFQACSQIETWQSSGILDSIDHISVNVSPRQFNQDNFLQVVRSTLEVTDVDPSLLTLEVTEGVVFDHGREVIEKMHTLKELGVRFSIDDFGTGYSSLSYLKQMPLDQLKIDRSFVEDISEDRNARLIVETIVALATHLEFGIIAEGVETVEQLRFLEQQGCDLYQGYYFSPPVSAAEFERLVREPNPIRASG